MLFLASCSEGFVRKLGEILSMAVSMWGAGYNRDGFSRYTHACTHAKLGHGFRVVGVPGLHTG